MRLLYNIQEISITGEKKKSQGKPNEDSYSLDREKGIFAVADGIGGKPFGKEASHEAINSINLQLQAVYTMLTREECMPTDISFLLEDIMQMTNTSISLKGMAKPFFKDIVDSIGHLAGIVDEKKLNNNITSLFLEEVIQQAQELSTLPFITDFQGMGTTLDVAFIYKNRAYLAHAGNGRMYKVDAYGQIQLLTKDHVKNFNDDTNMPEVKKTVRTMNNELTNYVGCGKSFKADIDSVPFHAGETLLLLSDGFSHTITPAELAAATGRLETFKKTIIGLYEEPKLMSNAYAHEHDISATVARKDLAQKDHATMIMVKKNQDV